MNYVNSKPCLISYALLAIQFVHRSFQVTLHVACLPEAMRSRRATDRSSAQESARAREADSGGWHQRCDMAVS